jgi:hypothetical protein
VNPTMNVNRMMMKKMSNKKRSDFRNGPNQQTYWMHLRYNMTTIMPSIRMIYFWRWKRVTWKLFLPRSQKNIGSAIVLVIGQKMG